MRESAVERAFLQAVKQAGGHCWKLVPNPAGVSDRVVLLPGGQVHFVELKTGGPGERRGVLSAIQRSLHARVLRDTGIKIITLYGSTEARAWVRDHTKEA